MQSAKRRLLAPKLVTCSSFDLAGVELQVTEKALLCRCQTCYQSWSLPRSRYNTAAQNQDWRCEKDCNSHARENLNPSRGVRSGHMAKAFNDFCTAAAQEDC
ncbi:MAG TPA: hypothetical protein V6C65_24730 [Allocoleopsis sp.]